MYFIYICAWFKIETMSSGVTCYRLVQSTSWSSPFQFWCHRFWGWNQS